MNEDQARFRALLDQEPPAALARIAAANPAELVAVRVIVTIVVAAVAHYLESRGIGTRQSWINHLSEACQEALGAADVSVDAGPGADAILLKDLGERTRRDVVEQINRILAGIEMAKNVSGTN